MREAKESDFFIELPTVGIFRFGRRTYGDRILIRSNYLRLVQEFGDSDNDLSMFAGMVATHATLCVDAPKGWADLSSLDVVSAADNETKVYELYGLLKSQEDSFRSGLPQDGQAQG